METPMQSSPLADASAAPAKTRVQLAAEAFPQDKRIEIPSMIAFTLLLGWDVARVLRFEHSSLPWIVLAAAVLGFIAADFGGGVLHWIFDTWGTEQTPIVGPTYIRAFRQHHVDEMLMTIPDFFSTNGFNCLSLLPVLGLASLVSPTSVASTFALAFLISACFWLTATNQTHQWAHVARPPSFVRVLQRLHLLLPPVHHSVHHAAPDEGQYCITSGWMNPVLDGTGFFRRLERIITATTGAQPCRDAPSPASLKS